MDLTPFEAPFTVDKTIFMLDLWPHPLTEEGREIKELRWRKGLTMAEVSADHGAGGRMMAMRNLVFIEPEEWESTLVAPGDFIALRADLEGDNPLRTVLQLATIAAALYFGGPLAGPLGSALGLSKAAALYAAHTAILVAGSYITNAIAPPNTPVPPGGNARQPEPVYSLSAGTNQQRKYQPMPLLFGEHRVFPDIASIPYTENVGEDEQFLYQIFHLGVGGGGAASGETGERDVLSVSDIMIGDTPASDFSDVEIEYAGVVDPGTGRLADSDISLVHGNVNETTGGDLEPGGAAVTRNTVADTNRIGIDLNYQIFQLNRRSGEYEDRSVELMISYIDTAIGGSPSTMPVTLTSKEQQARRRTVNIDLPRKSTWSVSVSQPETPPFNEDRYTVRDDVRFSVLRSYQPDEGNYSGQARIAMKIRASGQIHGALDKVSMTVKRLPRVGGTDVLSNPADVFLHFARGIYSPDGELFAGLGMDEYRLDLPSIAAWRRFCVRNDLRFDFELVRQVSDGEFLDIVASVGRASPSLATGKLGVVIDQESQPISGHIQKANILKGTFRVNWPGVNKLADEVGVEYIDKDNEYERLTLRRRVGGVTNPRRPVVVRVPGVTRRSQAIEALNLQAASQQYRAREMTWEMGRAGRGISRGKVYSVAHDLVSQIPQGRVLKVESANEIVLTEKIVLDSHGTIKIELPDGAIHESVVQDTPT